jgi:hypothetical protein
VGINARKAYGKTGIYSRSSNHIKEDNKINAIINPPNNKIDQ